MRDALGVPNMWGINQYQIKTNMQVVLGIENNEKQNKILVKLNFYITLLEDPSLLEKLKD